MQNINDMINFSFSFIKENESEEKLPFWKEISQEYRKDGFIVTLISWPKDRLIFMEYEDKTIQVPAIDISDIYNSKQELIEIIIKDAKIEKSYKYVYIFEIEEYNDLLAMAFFPKKAKPKSDFFKDHRKINVINKQLFLK